MSQKSSDILVHEALYTQTASSSEGKEPVQMGVLIWH